MKTSDLICILDTGVLLISLMCVCPNRVFRNKQVDSPLTAIDFTPDGAGLVVGSTQGRIYMYDLRNLSAPVKITTAHKTSVTCIRFQNSTSKLKVQLSVFVPKHISTEPHCNCHCHVR